MTAKFVYSKPYVKVLRTVYHDANGRIMGISKATYSKGEPMARYTVCSILNRDNMTLSFGVARCSDKDEFSKPLGRKLSFERAQNNPIRVVQIQSGEKISALTIKIANELMIECEGNHSKKF